MKRPGEPSAPGPQALPFPREPVPHGRKGLWSGCFLRLLCLERFPFDTWPDVEAPVIERRDFPRPPNAPAFPEPAIEHVMPPDVSLGPPTLQAFDVIAAPHDKTTDIVHANPFHPAFSEGELQVHPVPVPRPVVVKTGPRTRWKQCLAHACHIHRPGRQPCQNPGSLSGSRTRRARWRGKPGTTSVRSLCALPEPSDEGSRQQRRALDTP